MAEDSSENGIEVTDSGADELVIRFVGRLDVETSAQLLQKLRPLILKRSPSAVTADLQKITYLDDFGAMTLCELKNLVADRNGRFNLLNVSDQSQEMLSLAAIDLAKECPRPRKRRMLNIIVRLGHTAIREASNLRFMVIFLGSILFSGLRVLRNPKSLRVEDTITYMEQTGADALPIVALISFLLGLIMAFMSSMQLRQFGAGVYVASLVALAMVSELGPIMTAIVVAGRSGSAYAAEIGTMKISEEIDALFVMGFDPIVFLAIPRVIAAVIVVPLLTLFSDLFAVAGGLVVGVFMLDLTPNTYIKQSLDALKLTEVLWGMMKSAVFALLVSWVGCLRGFQARGGASAVGSAATSAVVSSIFLIILFDSIFAVIRSYWR